MKRVLTPICIVKTAGRPKVRTALMSGRKYRRTGVVVAQIGNRILAPLQYESTMNSQLFEVY